MNFGSAVKTCFRKYFTFSGRARRSEYWWFYLFTLLGSWAMSGIDFIMESEIGLFDSLFSLATLIPSLAAGSRRLHDTNRSGWWQALPLIGLAMMIPWFWISEINYDDVSVAVGSFAIVGGIAVVITVIMLIVWLATDSDEGMNRFGDSPKYGGIENAFD